MNEYSIAPREVTAKHLETVDFDSIVVITYDRHTERLTNWWHFSGHRDDWTNKELSEFAYAMTASTAEALKSSANVPQEREVKIKTIERVWQGVEVQPGHITLLALGIALNNDPDRRLWFHFDVNFMKLGFSFEYYENTNRKTNRPYWGIEILVGIFSFVVSRNK